MLEYGPGIARYSFFSQQEQALIILCEFPKIQNTGWDQEMIPDWVRFGP